MNLVMHIVIRKSMKNINERYAGESEAAGKSQANKKHRATAPTARSQANFLPCSEERNIPSASISSAIN